MAVLGGIPPERDLEGRLSGAQCGSPERTGLSRAPGQGGSRC